MQLEEILDTLLKTHKDFIDKAGNLLQQNVKDSAEKFAPSLIKLLLSNPETREHFFDKVEDATIFNYRRFIDYIDDKNFLQDSYTKFANKIGLTISNKPISQNHDVVLSFPFKDCILEGGQTKDEEKRKEIFFNEILAKDEITRLLDKKVLANAKKYTEKGVSEKVAFKRDETGTIKDNLIIKGNNLLALHSLKSNFAGKIKLIYIDPPYNTGNDSFNYNDNFNHSTWLTFMKNRLQVARQLLRDDGVIFVQCDDNEQAYLKVLMDEIFHNSFRNKIIWKKVLSTKKQSGNLSNVTEHILVYSKTENFKLNKFFIKSVLEGDYKNYPYLEEETNRRYGSFDFTQKGQGSGKYFNGKLLEPPVGKHWIWEQDKIDEGIKNNLIIFTKNNTPRVKRYLDEKEGNSLSDLWSDENVKIISANDSQRINFDGQKPEALLQRIINISTQPGDIVLDYHLGSGTTAAVAHKMGRQYIGIEQMEYIESIAVERMKKVLAGEPGGISKSVNWNGGGEFIYFELAKYNQQFIDKIKISTTENITTLYDEIKNKAFLNYDVEEKKLKQEKGEFAELSLAEQKKFLISILNKNQLYKNYSDLDDKDLAVSERDKKLSKDFYHE